jgi:hypothetical protein
MEAGVPMLMQGNLRLTAQPPQRKVDEFWKKFTTRAPGKGKKSQRPSPAPLSRRTPPPPPLGRILLPPSPNNRRTI